MSENLSPTAERRAPRVVVIGLASCFGCQINITNIERHLMNVLGQIDLGYWQLTSSVPMPDEFDVAVIEGPSPPRRRPRRYAAPASARGA